LLHTLQVTLLVPEPLTWKFFALRVAQLLLHMHWEVSRHQYGLKPAGVLQLKMYLMGWFMAY
jgi:hypothetical protein